MSLLDRAWFNVNGSMNEYVIRFVIGHVEWINVIKSVTNVVVAVGGGSGGSVDCDPHQRGISY